MSDSEFWRFSLGFYALPGVGAACIELQDRCDVDVNVLLFLLFLAERGRAVNRDDVSRIDGEVRAWREAVVMPLRSVRRALRQTIGRVERGDSEALRSEVKRIELESERIEQEALERLFPSDSIGVAAQSRVDAARGNLAAYGAHLGDFPEAMLAPLLKTFEATQATPR